MDYTTSIFDGHIEDIASRIKDRIIDMINYPCKPLFIRMDVRFPPRYPHCGSNTQISALLRLLKEPNTLNGIKIHYVWVREQHYIQPYYHVILLVNGSIVQNPNGLFHDAERIWGEVTGGNYPGLVRLYGHGYDLRNLLIHGRSLAENQIEDACQMLNFDGALSEALQRPPYPADGHIPKKVRLYGCSRIFTKKN